MTTQAQGNSLWMRCPGELNAVNVTAFRDESRAAITGTIVPLDIDLSMTTFMDSSGLGALIALHKTMATRGGVVRLLTPTATVYQILELTRLQRGFEIVKN